MDFHHVVQSRRWMEDEFYEHSKLRQFMANNEFQSPGTRIIFIYMVYFMGSTDPTTHECTPQHQLQSHRWHVVVVAPSTFTQLSFLSVSG